MRVTDELVQNEGEGFMRESECKKIVFDGCDWIVNMPNRFSLYGISIEEECIEILLNHESED